MSQIGLLWEPGSRRHRREDLLPRRPSFMIVITDQQSGNP
jgi:hypothetical protein